MQKQKQKSYFIKSDKNKLFNSNLSEKEYLYYQAIYNKENKSLEEYLDYIFLENIILWFDRDYSIEMSQIIWESIELGYIQEDKLDKFVEYYSYLCDREINDTFKTLMFFEALMDFENIEQSLEFSNNQDLEFSL